jgi:putative spermidine/putrescine transport system ATP-binding protein
MMQTSNRNSFVSMRSVGKTYDGKVFAAKGLNLEIQEGEFLTFLGPSGSGKTTTLMMLAGFERPTGGDIFVNGAPVTNLPPHKRNFGMVFQSYALFPHMTMLDNVAFPLKVRGLGKKKAHARAASALELVQLADFGSRFPMQLSGGQQQRAALARALVFEPTMVLMDEPLGALDTRLRGQMQMEIKQLHERLGNTMVSVTHDQTEALTMSDRIVVFNDGEIQQIATPTEIYERPVNSFVARFVGETNHVHGTVSDVRGDQCSVRLESGEVILAAARGKAAGDRTSVSLRPERLRILNDRSPTFANVFAATFDKAIYVGDHNRLSCRMLGRNDWIVKVSDSAICEGIKREQTFRIGWNAEDCLALDYLPV